MLPYKTAGVRGSTAAAAGSYCYSSFFSGEHYACIRRGAFILYASESGNNPTVAVKCPPYTGCIFHGSMSSWSGTTWRTVFKCVHILEYSHLDCSHRGPGGCISAANITKPNEQPHFWISPDTSAYVWVQSTASPEQWVMSPVTVPVDAFWKKRIFVLYWG